MSAVPRPEYGYEIKTRNNCGEETTDGFFGKEELVTEHCAVWRSLIGDIESGEIQPDISIRRAVDPSTFADYLRGTTAIIKDIADVMAEEDMADAAFSSATSYGAGEQNSRIALAELRTALCDAYSLAANWTELVRSRDAKDGS